MHPDDNDAQPTVRRHPSLAPDGELDLNWAYDTPLGPPRRAVEAPDEAPVDPRTPRPASTISPMLPPDRRDTARASAVDSVELLARGVFLVGLGALGLAVAALGGALWMLAG